MNSSLFSGKGHCALTIFALYLWSAFIFLYAVTFEPNTKILKYSTYYVEHNPSTPQEY